MLVLFLVLVIGAGCRTEPSSAGQNAPAAAVATVAAPPDSATARAFADVMAWAREERLAGRPLGEIMQAVGLRFKGRPYVAGMLDVPAEETLICRLDGFDCVTFYETALALARGITAGDASWEGFTGRVAETRYRDGRRTDYCSRLHYFVDWVADNERRGHVEDLTRDLGGIPMDKRLDFMTRNRAKYPRLADDDTYECLRDVEQRLAGQTFYYIPENRVRALYDRLQPGDILGTATSIGGLDVTHTGLVYVDASGRKGFLHASPQGGIKVSPDLERYLLDNKSQIGILVVRPTGR